MNDFFSQNTAWYEKIGRIYALLERVKISEEQSADVLHLRKTNRILSIGSTTAIEGNRLSPTQVSDVINGKPVLGPPKDIKEVQNAYTAYELIPRLNPYSVDDFLTAHSRITNDLINESGRFRTVGVFVVNGKGDILHSGADFNDVPALISELFAWGEASDAHPLIKSSAMHFMIEHIHPFRDGNGRIGRLWQTLVLTKWNALFEWMPIETIIYNNQSSYYEALQRSHGGADNVDCAPFIDFMLSVLENTMYKYIDAATTTAMTVAAGKNTASDASDIARLGVKLGVKLGVNQAAILRLIASNNSVTIKEMAEKIKISETAVQKNLSKLKTAGIVARIGSDKSGYWKIIGDG